MALKYEIRYFSDQKKLENGSAFTFRNNLNTNFSSIQTNLYDLQRNLEDIDDRLTKVEAGNTGFGGRIFYNTTVGIKAGDIYLKVL